MNAMNMKSIYLTLIIFFYSLLGICQSQGISINTTGNSPHASSILDIESDMKGVLIPRMTLSNRVSITTPANGLIVYQTDSIKGFWYNEGTEASPVWKHLGSGGGNLPSGVQNQTLRYNSGAWEADSFLTNTGSKIGIGTTNPTAGLEVMSHHGIRSSGILHNGSIQDLGAGVHLLWFPRKAAFRVGATDDGTMNGAPGFYPDGNTRWDFANIGQYSFSAGYANKASGISSASLGEGNLTTAKGAIAVGIMNKSSGYSSFTAGLESESQNYSGVTMGYSLINKTLSGTTIGIYNDASDTLVPLGLSPHHRIFQVGNGLSNLSRKNAMTVLYNGHIGIGTTQPLNLLEIKHLTSVGSAIDVSSLSPSNNKIAVHIKNYGSNNALSIKQIGIHNQPAAVVTNVGTGPTIYAEGSSGNLGYFKSTLNTSSERPSLYIDNLSYRTGLRIDNHSTSYLPHIYLFDKGGSFASIHLSSSDDSTKFWALKAYTNPLSVNDRMILGSSTAGDLIVLKGTGRVGVFELNPSARLESKGEDLVAIKGITQGEIQAGVVGEFVYSGSGMNSGSGVKGLTVGKRGGMDNCAGVVGINTGSGNENFGVIGAISGLATKGAGVAGFANDSTSGVLGSTAGAGPALKGEFAGAGIGTSLELNNGTIKVSGTNKPVFVHTTNAGNNTFNYTTIDHPFLNNNPNAMLLVTHQFNGNYLVGGIGVWYNNITNRWTIYLENNGLTMPNDEKFFVMVVL